MRLTRTRVVFCLPQATAEALAVGVSFCFVVGPSIVGAVRLLSLLSLVLAPLFVASAQGVCR